jgi:hypothetical protein
MLFLTLELIRAKFSKIRSLGCVLFELLFLKAAFPKGCLASTPLPDLGKSYLFKKILKKYSFNFFKFIHFFTVGIHFKNSTFRLFDKNWKERISSNDFYDYLINVIEIFLYI